MAKRWRGDDELGWWERNDLRVKVVTGAIGGLAALAAIYLGFFGSPFTSDPSPVGQPQPSSPVPRAVRITDCLRGHKMRVRRVTVGERNSEQLIFKRCDWPPLSAVSGDGYTQVVVQVTSLPFPNADMFNTIDAFRGPCEVVSVTYALDHMAGREFMTGTIEVGRVYHLRFGRRGGQWVPLIKRLGQVPPEAMNYIPVASEARYRSFVLRSGHFGLFDARCVREA